MKRMLLALLCCLVVLCVRAEGIDAKLDQYLGRMERFGFSGSVTVTRKGETLFNRAYGFSDREKNVRNTPDTIFETGSLFKQFTGAAILKLEEAGKLKTSDAIAKYLDGVPADKQPITIHQLLTMTSGIAISPTTEGVAATRERRIQQIFAEPLSFPPGTRREYTNAGYNLLAAIIEKVSGTSYEAFVRKALLEPAGLRNTAFVFERPLPFPAERVAKLYAGGQLSGWPGAERERATWFFKGAGAALTTTGDLCKWHAALESGRILSKEAMRNYVTPASGESGFAYGHASIPTPFGRMIEMGGGTTMGTGASLRRFRDSEVCIAVTINSDGEAFNDPVSSAVTGIVFDAAIPPPPAVIATPAAELGKLAGTYRVGSAELDVTAEGAGLRVAAKSSEGLAALFGSAGGDALRTKTEPILLAQIAGDFKPLHAAMRNMVPLAEMEANQKRMWAKWRSDLGELNGYAYLGATPEPGGDAAANYRLDFEKGSLWLQYVWFPRLLDGVRVLRTGPGLELLPSENGAFVAADLPARSFIVARLASGTISLERLPMAPSVRPPRGPDAAAGPAFPDTPAGAMARKFVESFNKGEPAAREFALSAFAPKELEKRPIEDRMESYRRLRDRFGTLALARVESSSATTLEVTLRDAKGAEQYFVFDVEAAAPHKLVSIQVRQIN